MRRHLAVPTVLAAFALTAGCSGGGAANGAVWQTPQTPVPPSASAGVKLPATVQATCDRATKINAGFGGAFMTDLRLRIDAASKGSSAKSRAQAKLNRDVSEYSSALASLAKSSGDPALKNALKQMSTQVKTLKGDLTKIDAKRMSAITGSLDKACGRS